MGSGPSQPRWFGTLRASLPPMKDKTVVITGTTSGTGYICAQVCGELGATVLLLNRSSQRSAKALESLRAAAPNGTFHAVECDLQNFASVRTAAAEVAKLTPEGIDVLCNNAGVMALEDVATKDGFDVQMQTNHLSHFLLTALLFPLLEKRAAAVGEARVVNHSSVARRMPDTPLSAAHLGRNGGNLGGNASGISMSGPRWERYHQTKLANCVFTYALHDRLQQRGSKVKALVAHPGLARTNLQVTSGEHGGMSPTFTGIFMKMLSQSGEDGAMGIVKCVCDSADAVASGQFWGPNRGMQLTGAPGLVTPEPLLNGEEDKKMLWQLSEEAVGEKFAL